MAARALRKTSGISGKHMPAGKPFQKGVSGNPSGLSRAERDRREIAVAHGQEVLPDGRTRVRAILDRICEDALGGSAPHSTLYLAYAVGKPSETVRIDGDVRLVLRPRTHQPEDTSADG